jgi:lipopolysaccharide/colanic/teichoic acid biosynthesis glycosyltransferase
LDAAFAEDRFGDHWNELAGGRYGRNFALIRIDRSVVAHGASPSSGGHDGLTSGRPLEISAETLQLDRVEDVLSNADHLYILVPEHRRSFSLGFLGRRRRPQAAAEGAVARPPAGADGHTRDDEVFFALPSTTGTEPTVYLPASQPRAKQRIEGAAHAPVGAHAAAVVTRARVDVVHRALDVLISATALLLLAPVLALVALALKLDSRGPTFYRSRRVGLLGCEFSMLKFRKMRNGAKGSPLTALDDERFTRMGRLLAKTKLDEIPQLWNVLMGAMSLVGPRPEDPAFVALRQSEYEPILAVKPGITGLSQIAFAREMEVLDPADRVGDYVRRLMPQKMSLDELYVTRRSVSMYVLVLWWTLIAVVLRRNVAVNRETGHLNLRHRPRDLRPEAAQPGGVRA